MGWQCRSSGRCYNSKSGVGTLMGHHTGKIVGYGVRCKDCKQCSVCVSTGKRVPEHDCSKNWSGSSKAMEPDVGAKLVSNIEKKMFLLT